MSDQLFITEFDDIYLPDDYHFSHNIAVKLYDDLVWLLKDSRTQKKINVKIKFKDSEKQPKDNEEDIIGWLIKNGHQKVANEIISKYLIFAIISDICHFTFQALESAKKIKMTVAYALIRKPFLENLLIIEQLLVDEHGFLKKFDGKPEEFDPGKLKDDEKKALIEKCLSKIKTNFVLNKDLVFDLRFDKNNPNSFYATSNLATHLVTTRHSEFKTESNNLNFVFSNQEDWDTQLHYFYYFVPYMLLYTTEVVDQYLLEKKIIGIKTYKKRKFMRLIGQVLQFDQFDRKSRKGNSMANKITKLLKVKCKSCNKTNQLFKSDLFSLIHHNYVLCKHCLIDLYAESNSLDIAINKIIK